MRINVGDTLTDGTTVGRVVEVDRFVRYVWRDEDGEHVDSIYAPGLRTLVAEGAIRHEPAADQTSDGMALCERHIGDELARRASFVG